MNADIAKRILTTHICQNISDFGQYSDAVAEIAIAVDDIVQTAVNQALAALTTAATAQQKIADLQSRIEDLEAQENMRQNLQIWHPE